ncbi:MAG: glycoside hydrolase family 3 C-terminal domain-containing protein [Clostridia bacterium]|nr:glycoside hydrolase family 3 C-terminal domain-containing protein [Clostridia bacterium]
MVLLKSDGSFPLDKPGRIALYGSGARRTLKGGTGSGDVNVRAFTTIEEGLKNAGFTITTGAWLDAYDAAWSKARAAFAEWIKARISEEGPEGFMMAFGEVMREPDYDIPLDGEGDTAVYVLARVCGEGADRKPVPGDFMLTETEIRDILRLQEQYPLFLLALNVGGPVDLSPVAGAVKNILVVSQLGMTIGDAFADVLLGKAYPSGKLATTWAAWEDYCRVGDFGEADDTRYREGVYVGYRYFDSVGKAPLFPFGFGLGYTRFETKAEKITMDGSFLAVEASVKNVGKRPGREVAQLYVSVPQGRLDQPFQTLAAFEKTDELQPGEDERVLIGFDLRDIASFDAETACEVLEAGRYILRLGTGSRDTKVIGAIDVNETVVARRLSHIGGRSDFADWKPEPLPAEALPEDIPVLALDTARFEAFPTPVAPPVSEEAKAIAAGLSDDELVYLCVGDYRVSGSDSFIGSAGNQVMGAAGESCSRFADKGIPSLVMADGPAGLRLDKQYGVDENGPYSTQPNLFMQVADLLPEETIAAMHLFEPQPERHGEIHDQYCTAIPVGTALAQSWNPEAVRACGDIVGDEMARFGVHLWLAPALNIHRSPLCGRNFEYYSEDPLISGTMAAAITDGVQSHPGRGVTIKHYACNNQETNRLRNNTIVSERALREIYLRGFRIAVERGDPRAVMTSYNLINGEHTSQREDLIETVLRGEWGFDGLVMSDWVVSAMAGAPHKYPAACASGSIKAGNDVLMPGSPIDHDDLINAMNSDRALYPVTRAHLEKCAARLIDLALLLHEQAEG